MTWWTCGAWFTIESAAFYFAGQSCSQTWPLLAREGWMESVEVVQVVRQGGRRLPPKPKGMHWKTYRTLANRFRRQDMAMDSAAAAYFGLIS